MKHYNLYFWQGDKRLIKRYLTRGELFDYLRQDGAPGRDLEALERALEALESDVQKQGYWNRFGWWHVQETSYKPF